MIDALLSFLLPKCYEPSKPPTLVDGFVALNDSEIDSSLYI